MGKSKEQREKERAVMLYDEHLTMLEKLPEDVELGHILRAVAKLKLHGEMVDDSEWELATQVIWAGISTRLDIQATNYHQTVATKSAGRYKAIIKKYLKDNDISIKDKNGTDPKNILRELPNILAEGIVEFDVVKGWLDVYKLNGNDYIGLLKEVEDYI